MELDPYAVAVAVAVRGALGEARVSGAELARQMGVSQSYIARRLLGRQSFTAAELLRIAALLDVPIVRLLPAAPDAASVA